jgi:hypothetical protein
MMGAFVEEEAGTESESESGRSADGVKRLVEAISPIPSPKQPTRRAGGEGTWRKPQPPNARLANTVTPRLVKPSAARKVVSPNLILRSQPY